MTTCDDVQLGLEMTRMGATSTVAPDVAAAHVATCATCAAYAATLWETDAMMTSPDLARRDGFDSDALLKKTLAELPGKHDVWKLVALVVSVMTALVVFVCVRRPEMITPRFIGMLGGMTVFGIAAFAYRRTRYRHWTALAGRPTEILAARRSELAKRVRMTSILAPLWLALAAHSAYNAITRDSLLRVVTTAGTLVFVALLVKHGLDARRELRALGDR